MKSPPIVFTRVAIPSYFLRKIPNYRRHRCPPHSAPRWLRQAQNAAVEAAVIEKAKHLLASFRKKKTEPMCPTLVQHFRYSQCDPLHERFAVDVPFAFATSCFRQGHRRYALQTWRREMHRDCWRTRGTSARSQLPIQLTQDSSSIISHSSTAGNQKPSRRCERLETA